MDVNVTDPFSHEMVLFYEMEDLFMFCEGCRGKKLQEREDFAPVLQVATGEFADNIWVTHYFSAVQQPFEVRVALPKMTYPY